MKRILPAHGDWPLHSAQASRELEQAATQALPPHTLMRRAGLAIAALTRALHPHAQRAWIACGPGNNGGDGLEAAMHLKAAGWGVEVSLAASDAARLPADAAAALVRAQAAGITLSESTCPSAAPDVALDAVLGLGLKRPPEGRAAVLIDQLNALACPVLAVDLPSGLGADTGQPPGVGVRAAHTLALLTLKPGLFTGAGRDHAGEVWFDDLGVDLPATAWHLGGASPLDAQRRHAQHKGSFGDVAIVGGATGMTGAALLAARAAHAAGAGRVYVDALAADAPTCDEARPELMFRSGWGQTASARALAEATVAAGCGGGDAVKDVLPRLLSAAGRLVLDADALNAVAADASLAGLLAARRTRSHDTVLTPHPLEAARLLQTTTAQVQADRLAAARLLAERLGCVVVLKGSGSVIADPHGTLWVNGTGNAALASAGTGDVLAGWIAGAWSASRATALEAARHATRLHGLAADRCPASPMRAADLIDAMHQAAGGR